MKGGRIRGRSGGHQQQQQSHGQSPPNGGTAGAPHPQQPAAPPPDVMSLTAKNYRLAKELVRCRFSPALLVARGLARGE
jgi:hypothetical protein